jgi:demethylsterigmatocystin 6-O-methyltransferase
MRVQREDRPLFFDALNFEERFARDTDKDTILFVDIGGSTGPQSRELRKRFPNLKGRVVLQDRPEVVAQAKEELKTIGIEAEVHDIFTPQTVKGKTSLWKRGDDESWLTFSRCPYVLSSQHLPCLGRSYLQTDPRQC